MKATFVRLAFLSTALLLSSCSVFQRPSGPPPEPTQTSSLWGWDDAADMKAKGPLSLTVILGEQKVKLYRGKTQIGWSYLASGISKYPTPVGSFQVLERTADKHSNLYGKIYDANGKVVNSDAKMGRDPIPEGGRFQGARMAYWMRLTFDGLGLHVGPIPRPGRPASHGCMRLPSDAAKKIFNTVSKGTPVYIVQNEGDTPVKYVPKPTPRPKPAAKPAESPAEKPATEAASKPEVRAPTESVLPALPATPGPAPVPTPAPATPAPGTGS